MRKIKCCLEKIAQLLMNGFNDCRATFTGAADPGISQGRRGGEGGALGFWNQRGHAPKMFN